MKKSVCLSQDSNLGSLIYLYGLIQPIRGRNRVKGLLVVQDFCLLSDVINLIGVTLSKTNVTDYRHEGLIQSY